MIKINEILGKNIAILHSDGLKVYHAILDVYESDNKLLISFEAIEACTTAFLNASIGKLLSNIPNCIDKLTFINTSDDILKKIEWVKENALNEAKRNSREESMREYFENA